MSIHINMSIHMKYLGVWIIIKLELWSWLAVMASCTGSMYEGSKYMSKICFPGTTVLVKPVDRSPYD